MKHTKDIKRCIENEYLNLTRNLNSRIEYFILDNKTDADEYEFLTNLKTKIDIAFARIEGFIDGIELGTKPKEYNGYKIPPTNAQF